LMESGLGEKHYLQGQGLVEGEGMADQGGRLG